MHNFGQVKSSVDDLKGTWYCKHESSLCATICWGSASVPGFVCDLYYPTELNLIIHEGIESHHFLPPSSKLLLINMVHHIVNNSTKKKPTHRSIESIRIYMNSFRFDRSILLKTLFISLVLSPLSSSPTREGIKSFQPVFSWLLFQSLAHCRCCKLN